MVEIRTLDFVQLPVKGTELLRSEFNTAGVTGGVLQIGRLNDAPAEYFFLWTDGGQAPVTMIFNRERLQDENRIQLAAQDFIAHWKQEKIVVERLHQENCRRSAP